MKRASVFLLFAASCLAGRGNDALVSVSAPPAAPAAPVALPHPPDPPLPLRGRVVLVVIDGARWQDIEAGNAPNLSRLARARGASLADIRATGPNFVSLPGYTEIFTGRAPEACGGNDCEAPEAPTVVDELVARGADSRDVAVFSSWSKIARAASSKGAARPVLSAGRDLVAHADALSDDPVLARTLAAGAKADPFPGDDDFRPDRYTAAAALRYLETNRPRFLFIGLGETDEYAHRGSYGAYVGALRAADDVVEKVIGALDRMGDAGKETTVFVTADHGRAKDYRHHGGAFPESARVWLVAAGAGVRTRGAVAAPRGRRLADLAPTMRALYGLPGDTSPSSGSVLAELLGDGDAL